MPFGVAQAIQNAMERGAFEPFILVFRNNVKTNDGIMINTTSQSKPD